MVITGLGSILAAGAGREALAATLQSGVPSLAQVDSSDGFHASGAPRLAALADSIDLSPWLDRRAARRMSRPSKYAVAAARMAIEDAGVSPEDIHAGDTAVVLGTAFGTASFAQALIDDILRQGPDAASPFHFSESVANAPAAQVAIAVGARGANVAVTQREAGPLLAVAAGVREIALGRSRFALVGATDEVSPLVHAILGRFGALAKPDRKGREIGKPFAPDRNGFLAAEGSVVLILESEHSARDRGATALARVVATARAFDPTAPPRDWGCGAQALASQLRRQLGRAGLTPGDLDRVISGASGARKGDALEKEVLERLFGPVGLPPVETPKASVGEYGGGALAAAVLSAQDNSGQRLLTSGLSAGGAAAWLVLEGP